MRYGTKAKRMRTFATAYDKYFKIEDEKDLAKNKLTLAEFDNVFDGLKALSKIDDSVFDTIFAGVADWFKRNGFTVVNHGVGYRISI